MAEMQTGKYLKMPSKKPSTHPSMQLFFAIDGNDFEAFEDALNRGANPNDFLDCSDISPLCKVLSNIRAEEKPKFIKKLMEHGALPGFANAHGSTAFMRACMRGDVASADIMLGCAKMDLLHRDNYHWLYSMAAVDHMSPEFLQRMQDRFEEKCWPENPDLLRNYLWTCKEKHGLNAMMIAWNNPDSLHWLLSHPNLNMADHLEQRCEGGKTVLWYAAEAGQIASVGLLLGAGAKTSTHDLHGRQLMDHLVRNSKTKKHAFVDGRHQIILEIMRAAHASQEASRAIDDLMSRKTQKSIESNS